MSGLSFTLLRQRFGTPEQMSRHLHSLDNRTLLFFREPRVQLAGGARVMVEVSFTDSTQQVILRGQVLGAVTEGTLRGLWLEFPDMRHSRLASMPKDRQQRRLACDEVVQIRWNGQQHLGRLTDLSPGGARIAGGGGARPGDDVELRIVSDNKAWPSELGPALVVRQNGSDLGVRFRRADSASRIALTRLYAGLQDRWNAALQVDHPPICCNDGLLLEPPLPRVKGRGASSPGVPL